METVTYSNISAEGLQNAIAKKKYGRYVFLYLYDGFGEFFHDLHETTDLFIGYGKQINNQLGDDVALLTVYDKTIVEKWGDFLGKKKLIGKMTYQKSMEPTRNHYAMMKQLAAAYGVGRLPALILIDTEGDGAGQELVAKKELDLYTAEEIYSHIVKTVNAIRNHYGDFAAISCECEAGICAVEKRLKEQVTVQETLKEITNRFMKKAGVKQYELCERIGVNDRMFRKYMNEWETNKTGEKAFPLPRRTAIAIAFALKLTPEEADELFDAALVTPVPRLGDTGRDWIIREGLRRGKDPETVDRELAEGGWPAIGE